jgi:hypothetical protein
LDALHAIKRSIPASCWGSNCLALIYPSACLLSTTQLEKGDYSGLQTNYRMLSGRGFCLVGLFGCSEDIVHPGFRLDSWYSVPICYLKIPYAWNEPLLGGLISHNSRNPARFHD